MTSSVVIEKRARLCNDLAEMSGDAVVLLLIRLQPSFQIDKTAFHFQIITASGMLNTKMLYRRPIKHLLAVSSTFGYEGREF